MSELLFGLTAYRRLVGARARAQMEYRLSFWMTMVGQAAITVLDFATIVFIFSHVPALAGWSFEQVAFLYAVAGMSFAITDLLVGNLDSLATMVKRGDIDVILTRPLGSLMQVVASEFALRRLGKGIQSVAVLVWVFSAAEIPWSAGRVGMLVVTIIVGAVIYAAVWVAFAAITFFSVDSIEVVNAFTYGGNYLASYPLGVFSAWLRRFLAFVVPIAFVAYFPALYILDRPDPLGFPPFLRFAGPAVALGTVVVARAAWRFAIRHYRSTGS